MRYEERWQIRYNEVKSFIEERHCEASKYVGEEGIFTRLSNTAVNR